MKQIIKDLPISKVEKIEETASAKEAANRMKNRNVNSLGLVTESDLVKKVCTSDVLPEKVGIAEIMSSPVIYGQFLPVNHSRVLVHNFSFLFFSFLLAIK
jgi:signal-transduction protein with cAMP-binding, CBS, and nucleotidyltransferase domain